MVASAVAVLVATTVIEELLSEIVILTVAVAVAEDSACESVVLSAANTGVTCSGKIAQISDAIVRLRIVFLKFICTSLLVF